MPLPKKKTSRSRRDKRRTHDRLSEPALSKCSHCGQPKISHRICPHCGYYGGRMIKDMEKTKG
ncbi:MAG: 50S ribosomal protein L32 [Nitrospirae bacterium]|nr:50S ribosomal protein L32 [Nitrospirota bacterium]